MAQLICQDLCVGYDGKAVLQDLSFAVFSGDYLCIVGENGSGKSTLMKTILGLQQPVRGRILTLDGLRKNEIGYLPQQTQVQKDFPASVREVDDLNLIIRDIREAHKKDSESAPQTTVADELKENLEAVENFKGSRDEKLVVLYCKQLGINYKNLSDEEFRWLIRILKKSKKMGTPISQRKKR